MIKDWIYAAVGVAGIARAVRQFASSYGTYSKSLSPRTEKLHVVSTVSIGGEFYSLRRYYPIEISGLHSMYPPMLYRTAESIIENVIKAKFGESFYVIHTGGFISSGGTMHYCPSIVWSPTVMLRGAGGHFGDFDDIRDFGLDKATLDILYKKDDELAKVVRKLGKLSYSSLCRVSSVGKFAEQSEASRQFLRKLVGRTSRR